jgi:hypothetical protein
LALNSEARVPESTTTTTGEGRIAHHSRLGVTEAASADSEEMLLQPGDSLTFHGEAAYTMQNAGEGSLVLLVAGLMDSTQPGLLYHEHHEH